MKTVDTEDKKAFIRVYTRAVDEDSYPAGLAYGIHISCSFDGEVYEPFNKNYGILFAEGLISSENTIIPMGIRDPRIFCTENGEIGIVGTRIHENGSDDEDSAGKAEFWTTADLIHFEQRGLTDAGKVPHGITDTAAIDIATARAALLYWSPIVCTGAELPDNVSVKNESELDGIEAVIRYSDGSFRKKRIYLDESALAHDKTGDYTAKGTIRQQSFTFPLAKGYGDPVIFKWEGKWYYISTNDNLDDIGIYVREGDRVEDLFAEGVTEHLILPFDPERGFEQTFWAPEFHVIGGELYILFAVSGHIWGPQCHMMKKKRNGSITDPGGWEDPVRVIKKDGTFLADDAITLDMTFIRADSGAYVVWSYRENIGTAMDSGSMLYIASIDEREPWKLTSDPVLLTRPLYGWENVSGTINNEGPNAFLKDGRVYLTYSGGSANRYTYALGLLTADTDSDLTDISSWTKSITPVLTFYSVEGEYGPGHNSFFVNDAGELMIAYHAETDITETLRCDGIRRVHFRKDGTPYFGMSADDDVREETADIKIHIV